MVIRTITCHDVYNAGASLQAYALVTYLRNQGHDARIIDYKPPYLSNHYSLTAVANPKYDKPFLKIAYLTAKFPARFVRYCGTRKRRFDAFRKEYLPLTDRYDSYESLTANPPQADIYMAGSDQIWNTAFQNGKDPAFYLEFAPEDSIRASYAASFAAEHADSAYSSAQSVSIGRLDYVSVREQTGLRILKELGIENGTVVIDPVFLLPASRWLSIASHDIPHGRKPYILVYDFDGSDAIRKEADILANQYGCEVYSVFQKVGYNRCLDNIGPLEFIAYIRDARFILSNSFHATAFSLILHKPFMAYSRKETLNSRMRDLVSLVGLSERTKADDFVDWADVDMRLSQAVRQSELFIERVTNDGHC